ncbi:unnamed protein product [Acanthoscelides obtectus]|uniref:Uncharacterized protein n=1 Tax=Acanthoscelides obtectus TaxID=200917 RepID=A0A9P0KFX0_ACAOB|nr:unnamed protein product [Acanthoscelides obtectus]CAK1629317.1 hypothetical protein AOBTE_LOCUS5678 [Acanthoscelides obtectus]
MGNTELIYVTIFEFLSLDQFLVDHGENTAFVNNSAVFSKIVKEKKGFSWLLKTGLKKDWEVESRVIKFQPMTTQNDDAVLLTLRTTARRFSCRLAFGEAGAARPPCNALLSLREL